MLASDAPRVALAEQFIEAFNRGDRSAALALMVDDPGVSDCVYKAATVVDLRGRDQVSAWLDSRIADHDRFTTERIENGSTDASSTAIGVTFARRNSGSGNDLRIEEFANGPVGGDPSKLCKAV